MKTTRILFTAKTTRILFTALTLLLLTLSLCACNMSGGEDSVPSLKKSNGVFYMPYTGKEEICAEDHGGTIYFTKVPDGYTQVSEDEFLSVPGESVWANPDYPDMYFVYNASSYYSIPKDLYLLYSDSYNGEFDYMRQNRNH